MEDKELLDKIQNLLTSDDDENIILALTIAENFQDLLYHFCIEYLLVLLCFSENEVIITQIRDFVNNTNSTDLANITQKCVDCNSELSIDLLNYLIHSISFDFTIFIHFVYTKTPDLLDNRDIYFFLLQNNIVPDHYKQSLTHNDLHIFNFQYENIWRGSETEIDVFWIESDFLDDETEIYNDALEIVKAEQLLAKDCDIYTLLNELGQESDYFDSIDDDGEETINTLYQKIPTLKKYERIFIDERLWLGFLSEYHDEYF